MSDYTDEAIEQGQAEYQPAQTMWQTIRGSKQILPICLTPCTLLAVAIVVVIALIPLYTPAKEVTVKPRNTIPFVVTYGVPAGTTNNLMVVNTQALANQLSDEVDLPVVAVKYAQLSASTTSRRRRQANDNMNQCGRITNGTNGRLVLSINIASAGDCYSTGCKRRFLQKVDNHFKHLNAHPRLSMIFCNGESLDVVGTFLSIEQVASNFPTSETTAASMSAITTTLTTQPIITTTTTSISTIATEVSTTTTTTTSISTTATGVSTITTTSISTTATGVSTTTTTSISTTATGVSTTITTTSISTTATGISTTTTTSISTTATGVSTITTTSISTTATAVSTTTTPATTTTTRMPTIDDLCLTPYCVKAANYLLDSIDQTINPCEDFYQFACGTWLKNTRIPADASIVDAFSLLQTQLESNIIDLLSSTPSTRTVEPNAVLNARNLYNSCIDEAGIESDGVEPVLSIINNEFGGWPILEGDMWNASTYNLSDLLLKLRRYHDGFIFSVATGINPYNSSVYEIQLHQGTLGLEEAEYYNEETAITVAYRQFMFDLASALTNNTQRIASDVEDMYAFEKNISQDQRLQGDGGGRTTILSLSTSLKSGFDFTSYLRQAYLIGNVTLVNKDIVLAYDIPYLKNVLSIIQSFPPRVIQNYLVWRFMMNRAASMPKRFRSISEQFDRVRGGITAEPVLTTVCADYVNGYMSFAVSRLYILKYFDENARSQTQEMIKNVRASMKTMIENASWMDDDSRAQAVDKLQAIYENVGYPDFVVSDNTTQLEQMYAEYIFDKSHLINALQMRRIVSRKDFRKLREVVDHRAWGDDAPTVVNAFYGPSTNAITILAAILQLPFFDKDAPKYLNYGGTATTIGHEIAHGFDNNGRLFDKNGNYIPWWSDNTISQFNERAQCLIDQYSNYTVEQIHMNLSGEQTEGENIADNGGIKSAFYAYQNWVNDNPNVDKRLPGLSQYSQEQMFFIGFGHIWCGKYTDTYARLAILSDPHSIDQFRVLGPLSNFDEFDRVFNCTPGQGNSRVNKCVVW